MHFRYQIIWLTFFSFILFPSCDAKFSEGQSKISRQSQERVEEAFGGLSALVESDQAINYKRVYAVLKDEQGISYRDIVSTKDKNGIKKLIQKLQKLTQNKRIVNDKELTFAVHGILANEYLRLYGQTKNNKHLNQSIDQALTALSIFKDNPQYKVALTDIYSILINDYFLKGDYNKSIKLLKYVIVNYQSIDFGPHKNWYASQKVMALHNLAGKVNLETERKKEIIEYMRSIAERYNNEVGITAQVELLQHSLSQNKIKKAKTLEKSIQNKLVAINNPAFVKKKKQLIKMQMERAELRAQNKKQKHERMQ